MIPFKIILSIICTLNFALAEDFVVSSDDYYLELIQENEYSQTIFLSGNFTKLTDHEKAIKVLEYLNPNKKFLIIDLNFGGGKAPSIDSFANNLKKYCKKNECTIITRVKNENLCSSYCMKIYMLGSIRIAYNDARFGFHTAQLVYPFGIKIKSTKIMLAEYEKHDVSKDWLKENRTYFEELKVTHVYPDSLEGSNIVTKVLDCNDGFDKFITSLYEMLD